MGYSPEFKAKIKELWCAGYSYREMARVYFRKESQISVISGWVKKWIQEDPGLARPQDGSRNSLSRKPLYDIKAEYSAAAEEQAKKLWIDGMSPKEISWSYLDNKKALPTVLAWVEKWRKDPSSARKVKEQSVLSEQMTKEVPAQIQVQSDSRTQNNTYIQENIYLPPALPTSQIDITTYQTFLEQFKFYTKELKILHKIQDDKLNWIFKNQNEPSDKDYVPINYPHKMADIVRLFEDTRVIALAMQEFKNDNSELVQQEAEEHALLNDPELLERSLTLRSEINSRISSKMP